MKLEDHLRHIALVQVERVEVLPAPGGIVAQMAVVMLAGGKAMKGMFGIDETFTIICLAVLAGSYTIYGGLVSVAGTDFLQFVVMMLGGLVVTVIGLHKVGGLHDLMLAAPEKFKIIYPITDKEYPWFGVWSLFISIGIWYNCTNQFIVQRCLGARSEWDGRMGVVFAGYMKILTPLICREFKNRMMKYEHSKKWCISLQNGYGNSKPA